MKRLIVTCEEIQNISKYQEAGADEVILALEGGCFSSMRVFSVEEIEDVCRKKDIHTAVLMNRLFPQDEIQKAEETLERVLACADEALFADPALLRKASELHKQDQMIYRPETLMTNALDAQWWMDQGIASVQISPLLTADEIASIASAVQHTSLQIHGRLLMSVSKRPLLSAYEQAANTMPLYEKRDLYLREDKREGRMPIYENACGAFIYTDYVQESFDYMQTFIDAGIERFEIDGTDEEDAFLDAVKIYRAILDGGKADSSTYLETYHSIPFSTGYYGQKTVK